MLSKILHALLRGITVYFGFLIVMLSIKAITENDYFHAIMFISVGALFLVYGFGGSTGVKKFFPPFSNAASQDVKTLFKQHPKTNTQVKPNYKIRLSQMAGTALMVLSYYEFVATPGMVPINYQFPNYPWLILATGFALTIPNAVYIFKNRSKNQPLEKTE
jgi:hypothetical protein